MNLVFPFQSSTLYLRFKGGLFLSLKQKSLFRDFTKDTGQHLWFLDYFYGLEVLIYLFNSVVDLSFIISLLTCFTLWNLVAFILSDLISILKREHIYFYNKNIVFKSKKSILVLLPV